MIINEVVFAGDSGNAVQLFRMNADGSSIRRLTHGYTRDTSPRISPDGRSIAFVRTTNANNQIWIVDANGELARQVTFDTTLNANDLAWSPTGKQIVFETQETNYRHRDIHILDIATGDVVNITASLSTASRRYFHSPDWSVNNEIIFANSDTLYWVTPTGTVLRKRYYPELYLFSFRWSPDGSRIAFTYDSIYSDPPNLNVGVIDRDGGNFRTLTRTPGIDSDPEWSPAGTELLFRSERDHYGTATYGEAELYIMPLSFGEDLVRRLTFRPGVEWQPSWK